MFNDLFTHFIPTWLDLIAPRQYNVFLNNYL